MKLSAAAFPRMLDVIGDRRPDIQGLRAIAVLMVVAFHAGLPIPGGFVGVDVFFVISGFVITAMLRREWAATGQIRFSQFYIRRFKRLTPALALMVSATVAISALVLSPAGDQQTAAKTGIGAIFLAANVVIANTTGGYFDAPAHVNPLLHTWSLSVEEQFYLFFPLFLGIGWRLGRQTGVHKFVPLFFVGILAAISFILAVIGSTHYNYLVTGYPWLVGFYNPLTRVWEFSAGALIALFGSRLLMSSGVASACAFAGLAALCAALEIISDKTPFPGLWTLLPVTGTVLLILAGHRDSNPVSRALGSRSMVKIGDWSYSIYLWHWPLIVFAAAIWPELPYAPLCAVMLSFGVALASYYWVEQPIRAMPMVNRASLAGLVAVTMSIPIILSGTLGVAGRTWLWNAPLRDSMSTIRSLPTGWRDPICITRIPLDKRDARPCQWHSAESGAPIYLVGDSNAMHFSEAVIRAGEDLHRPVTTLGTHGCPFIDVYIQRSTDRSVLMQCRENYMAMMDWLRKQPPGTVMISSVDRYWRDPDYEISLRSDFRNSALDTNSQNLNIGLINTVRNLQAVGHSVILVQTVPHFTTAPYTIQGTNCSGWRVLVGDCSVPVATMPVGFTDELQSESRKGIIRVANETGARIFDLRDFFCPDGICRTRHASGTDLYMMDGYHLNKRGSALLKDEFITEFRAMK